MSKLHIPHSTNNSFTATYGNTVGKFSTYIFKGYIQQYCVHYNLTHEHKGTQWGRNCFDVEDHYLSGSDLLHQHYNLTHEHKGTQWRGRGSYVENHHQKVEHSYWKQLQSHLNCCRSYRSQDAVMGSLIHTRQLHRHWCKNIQCQIWDQVQTREGRCVIVLQYAP